MAQCGAIGLACAIISTMGVLYCVSSRYWKINSQVSSQQVNRGVASYEGLWVRCISYIPGQFQCDRFDSSYLGLEGSLNAQRALMVMAAIFAAAGLVAGCLGMDCVHAIRGKEKRYSSRGGGVLILVSGIFTLASVSWYAADVYKEFSLDTQLQSSFAYQFGTALFIGWIASGLALIGGVLIIACGAADDDDEKSSYTVRYGGPSSEREYI